MPIRISESNLWCNRMSSGFFLAEEAWCMVIYTILSFIEKLGIYHESRPLTPELEILVTGVHIHDTVIHT